MVVSRVRRRRRRVAGGRPRGAGLVHDLRRSLPLLKLLGTNIGALDLEGGQMFMCNNNRYLNNKICQINVRIYLRAFKSMN